MNLSGIKIWLITLGVILLVIIFLVLVFQILFLLLPFILILILFSYFFKILNKVKKEKKEDYLEAEFKVKR